MDFLQTLVLGAYAFGGGCYLFVWRLFQAITQLRVTVATLAERVDNHHEHALEDLTRRVDTLERG